MDLMTDNYWTKYLFWVLVLVIFCRLNAQPNPGQQPELEKITRISAASEPAYPPYCIVDADGNADGFSVELFKAAAAAVGIEVDIKIGVWKQIKQDLAEGKIDALPLVGRTPEREALYEFTFPYMSLHGAVFMPKDATGIQSVADLKNKKIVVMKGDNAEEFVRREKVSQHIYTTHTFEEAFSRLANGEFDVVITQRVMGLQLLKSMGVKSIEPLDFQLDKFRQDFCFAVRKGDTKLLSRLNEGLSIVIANGSYNEIHRQWFSPTIKQQIAFKDILKITLYLLVPLIVIVSLIMSVVLRSEVKRKTAGLKQEIFEREKIEKELLTSRETYLNLFQNAQVGLFRTRIEDGKILEGNEQIAKMFGYKNRKEFIDHYVTSENYVDPGTRERMLNQIKTTGEVQNFEARFYRKDDTIFYASYSARIYPENGWIEGVVEDIIERKQAEEQLARYREQLEELVKARTEELHEKIQKLDKSQKALLYMVEDLNKVSEELKKRRLELETTNKELESFSYSVSHDLRAPLRSIDGFSRFLQEGYAEKLDEKGLHYLERVRAASQRMGRLIDD
ncbi:MAG: transporter substrate-binding domain-containing protein, partial [bacterium]|nr:transporter substrate-binding domain-containing protein [bacterium]